MLTKFYGAKSVYLRFVFTTVFCKLYHLPFIGQQASLADNTGSLLPRPAYNASKPMIILNNHSIRRCWVYETTSVAMADSEHNQDL